MGQKVHPYGLRLNINKTWKSKWYVDPREYAEKLHEDLNIRKIIEDSPETRGAEVADIEIIRHPQRITVIVHSGRPGAIIGAKGANIEKLGVKLQKLAGAKVQIKIKEIKNPETNAQLIAKNIGRQLKARFSFRRVIKMAIANARKAGVLGIKIRTGGRLGGSEMGRVEEYKEGRIPLHTFRADIDYGFAQAITTFGSIGIKVWIFNGEIFGHEHKVDAGTFLKKQKPKTRRDVKE